MKILKEIIISLLSCFLILLILGLVFYRFIPNNKIVPETIKYQASQEVQSEINSEVDSNSNKIIKTYEITASDLEKYQVDSKNLIVEFEDVEKEFTTMSEMYNMEVEKIKQLISPESIKADLANQKALDFIKTSVK